MTLSTCSSETKQPVATKAKTMRALVVICAFNEGEKVRRAIDRHPKERNYDLLVMDDGSTDGALDPATLQGITILRNETNLGVGASMKRVFEYMLAQGYDVVVFEAGNDKDNPLEIPRLLDPVLNGQADFVQGSRFLPGGGYGNTPLYRVFATRFVHPTLLSLAVGKRLTDTTNGFRAIHASVLRDPRIDWHQEWLNKYELEPFLLFKAIKLGYRHREVPVTKVYPPHHLGYTKMKPFSGWWSIMRPVFYLWFRVKR